MPALNVTLNPGDELLLTRGASTVRVRRLSSAGGRYWLGVRGGTDSPLQQTYSLQHAGRGAVLDVGGAAVVLRIREGAQALDPAVPLRVEAPDSVTVTTVVAGPKVA